MQMTSEQNTDASIFDLVSSYARLREKYNHEIFSRRDKNLLVDSLSHTQDEKLPGGFHNQSYILERLFPLLKMAILINDMLKPCYEIEFNTNGLDCYYLIAHDPQRDTRHIQCAFLRIGARTLLIETSIGFNDDTFYTRIWCESMEVAAEIFATYLMVI